MAFMRVPEHYRDGIAVLAALNDTSFADVYEALRAAPDEITTVEELSSKVASATQALDATSIKKLLNALTSLYRVSIRVPVPPDKLATELYQTIEKEGRNLVGSEQAPAFKARLTKFLTLQSLGVTATKAKELQTDVERAFCDAKILTDLRPVFGKDVADFPSAMIVVHTLKLSYHDLAANKHKEIFVGLDANDIVTLKKVLERAEIKAKTLASKLKSSGIRPVDLE